jgi:hypothetical protein
MSRDSEWRLMAGIAPSCLSDAPDRGGPEAGHFRALGDATRLRIIGLLVQGLLDDNTDHVAACCRTPEA